MSVLHLTTRERFVLGNLIDDALEKHPLLVEGCGDYDIPQPEKELREILKRLRGKEEPPESELIRDQVARD